MKKTLLLALLSSLTLLSQESIAQTLVNEKRVPLSAFPHLLINPNIRAAGLGDGGIALSPDANALYANAAQTIFKPQKLGLSLSYSPWLRNLVGDMALYHVSGYRSNGKSAFGLALSYFKAGEVLTTNDLNTFTGKLSPNEFNLNGNYAKKLSNRLSVGVTLKYLHSRLFNLYGNASHKRTTGMAGADISLYYRSAKRGISSSSSTGIEQDSLGQGHYIDWGMSIANIGGKVNYGGTYLSFMPTNLRAGLAYTLQSDGKHRLIVLAEAQKLLVPTPVLRDAKGKILKGRDPETLDALSALFVSLGDAPDGLKEELQEINVSLGAEYWYNRRVSGRIGYFGENAHKGNRQYLTLGIGIRGSSIGLDVAYMLPMNGNHSPLANTLRFGLIGKL